MTRSGLATLALLLLAPPLPAAAEAPEPGAIHLAYSVYAAGLNVLKLQSDVDINADHYRIDLSFRTAGLFGAVIHSEITSFAQGRWMGLQPAPLLFASWGQIRGDVRRTTIDYVGGQPRIRALEPAVEADRDPVPSGQQRDTIDTLSAMAMLVRQVNATGSCDGHATMFDGRRLSEITARTAGVETLEPVSRSSFAGPALRCEMTGHQLGGFQHDAGQAELQKPHYSTAWLAALVPGGQKLPVRVTFETRFFGHATAYVTEASPRAPAQ